jgi:hypothetical protein
MYQVWRDEGVMDHQFSSHHGGCPSDDPPLWTTLSTTVPQPVCTEDIYHTTHLDTHTETTDKSTNLVKKFENWKEEKSNYGSDPEERGVAVRMREQLCQRNLVIYGGVRDLWRGPWVRPHKKKRNDGTNQGSFTSLHVPTPVRILFRSLFTSYNKNTEITKFTHSSSVSLWKISFVFSSRFIDS